MVQRRYLDTKTMCPILTRSQKSWHLYLKSSNDGTLKPRQCPSFWDAIISTKKWRRNDIQWDTSALDDLELEITVNGNNSDSSTPNVFKFKVPLRSFLQKPVLHSAGTEVWCIRFNEVDIACYFTFELPYYAHYIHASNYTIANLFQWLVNLFNNYIQNKP